MSFLNKLFGNKQEDKHIQELIKNLGNDLQTGLDYTLMAFESIDELSQIGEPAVKPLIKVLSRSSYAHLALAAIGGERAFKALCQELQTNNYQRIAAAANALGEMGDQQALQYLQLHSKSKVAEVNIAVTKAIAEIERKNSIGINLSAQKENSSATQTTPAPELLCIYLDFKSKDQLLCTKLCELVTTNVEREVAKGIVEFSGATIVEDKEMVLLKLLIYPDKLQKVTDSTVRWWNHFATQYNVIS